MANERSTLTKNRKLEKSFEDLLTGLSDENDDDIDDLVDFSNLPETCSEDTLIAITTSNKPYSKSGLDDSLRMSEFIDDKTDQKQSRERVSKSSDDVEVSDLDDDEYSRTKKSNTENEKLIDFDVETVSSKRTDDFGFDNYSGKEDNRLIDFDHDDVDEDVGYTDIGEMNNDHIYNENSTESNETEELDDKYEGNFDIEQENEPKVELMVTDESGYTVDLEQNVEGEVNGFSGNDSIDLDAIVQDNAKLDVDIGKQKTQLRKKGSLAKRRKPSRNSIHNMGVANEESHFTDSTEPKPEIPNGHADEDVFDQQNSSNDSDVSSPPAKKPLPGMVALPGLGMPMPASRKKTGSTPSDGDITSEEGKKDFRTVGVKLPIPSSRGSSDSDNQPIPNLRKTSEKELIKSPVENTHQFEKPKLKAVSLPERERKDSEESSSAKYDIPVLRQVEKTPRKSRGSSGNVSEDTETKHLFQTPKLRKVEDAPTESLQFFSGKTGENGERTEQSRISGDSKHRFETPKLKKVDNPPTKTLKLLHGRTDEAMDSETLISLGHHNEESSTDDIEYSKYFEKPLLRNVPKPTETLRNLYHDKSQFDVPELKNVPKSEVEIKSPGSSDSDKKFNVPALKSVQKESTSNSQEKEEGTFQIPTLRSTPLPKRREPPKSPETKTFEVPALRRTPRVKGESEHVESEKPNTGFFEKPKLKSARSLHEDMDDISNKDSHRKHRFDMPTLRNTPSKQESSVQRSDSSNNDREKPSWLQETKLRPSHEISHESFGDQSSEKPSWLSDSKGKKETKENKNKNSHDVFENTPRKSSIPLQETKDYHDNTVNSHNLTSRNRLTSTGSENDEDEVKSKKSTARDQYVPSWLKTTDTRGKSPSTPNLAFVTPSKDPSEVPQWKKELAEKRRGRRDSDTVSSPRKPESEVEKGLPPWKIELGQKKMRHTPIKAHETKKTTEPEWKKAADEKRQRLRKAVDFPSD